MQKIKLRKEPSIEAKMSAYDYQREAFEKIKDLEYASIFHEQGLGKTKIAVDLILYWLDRKKIDVALILTKKMLIRNWMKELDRHTYLTPSVLTNNKSDNYYVFNGPSRVIITNFETIVTEFKRFSLFLKSRSVAIVIDESARIKNPESKITRSLFELSPLFVKRIIMTGTPVANRPFDIWAQIFFLDGGESLGDDFVSFKSQTNLSNKLLDDPIRRMEFEDTISSIFEKIESFSVRETKDSGIIELPPKHFYTVPCAFEPNQHEIYEQIRREESLHIVKDGVEDIDTSEVVLKRLLRLIQATSNPKLIDESYSHIPGKMSVLGEMLEEIIQSNEKCIVWSSFVDNVDWLVEKFKKYNPVKVHGAMSQGDRDHSIEEFIENSEVMVLFATPQSAKEGLTLTVANHAIFYDRNLSLDDYLQAQDRIHRISQKKDCHIYNMIIEDSIDEWIDSLVMSKSYAAKLTQGDLTIEEYRASVDYGFSEIIEKILKG